MTTFSRASGDYGWSLPPTDPSLLARVPLLVGLAAARSLEGVLVVPDDASGYFAAHITRDGLDEHGRPQASARIQRFSALNAFEVTYAARGVALPKPSTRPLSRALVVRLATGRVVSLAPEDAYAGVAHLGRYDGFFCATTVGWSFGAALEGLLLCGVSVPPDPRAHALEALLGLDVDVLATMSKLDVDAMLRWLDGVGEVPDHALARTLLVQRHAPRPDELTSVRVLMPLLRSGALAGRSEAAEELVDALSPSLSGGRDALVSWLAREDVTIPPPIRTLPFVVWRELLDVVDPIAVLEHLLLVESDPGPLSALVVGAITKRNLGPRALLPRRILRRHPGICARLAELPGWDSWAPDLAARRAFVNAAAEQVGLHVFFAEEEDPDVIA